MTPTSVVDDYHFLMDGFGSDVVQCAIEWGIQCHDEQLFSKLTDQDLLMFGKDMGLQMRLRDRRNELKALDNSAAPETPKCSTPKTFNYSDDIQAESPISHTALSLTQTQLQTSNASTSGQMTASDEPPISHTALSLTPKASTGGQMTASAVGRFQPYKVKKTMLHHSLGQFCNSLDLEPEGILRPYIVGSKLEKLRTAESITDKDRVIIQRTYVDNVMYRHSQEYGSYYVDKSVKAHLARKLVETFPGLRDPFKSDSGHDLLFTEDPQGGTLYGIFKNRAKLLPPESKKRNIKKKCLSLESAVTTTQYENLVDSLQAATLYREQERMGMLKTFPMRREWIVNGLKVSMEAIAKKFPLLARERGEIESEFARILPKFNPDKEHVVMQFFDGYTLENLQSVLTRINKHLKKEYLILPMVQANAMEQEGCYIATSNGQFHLVVIAGSVHVIAVQSFADAALLSVKAHYCFNIKYCGKNCQSLYGVIESLLHIPVTVNLGAAAKKQAQVFLNNLAG